MAVNKRRRNASYYPKRYADEVNELRQLMKANLASEKEALKADDPKGACAAHHRGAIEAYTLVISKLDALEKKIQGA